MNNFLGLGICRRMLQQNLERLAVKRDEMPTGFNAVPRMQPNSPALAGGISVPGGIPDFIVNVYDLWQRPHSPIRASGPALQ